MAGHDHQDPPRPDMPAHPGVPDRSLSRHDLFESIVVNANDVVLVTEAEPIDLAHGGPKVLYVNPAFTRMTGYSSEEIVGRTPRILQSPSTDRAELDRLRAALKAWEPVEVELLNVRKDGVEFWVQINITPVTNADGWYTHWVAVQRDITARKHRESALRTLLESTSDLMVLVGAEHEMLAVSATSMRLLGAPAQELTGRSVADLVHPEDLPLLADLLAPAPPLRFGRGATAELRLRRTDGQWRWFDVSAVDPGDQAGQGSPPEEVRLALACADITEFKQAQESLAELNRRFRSAFDDAPIGMAITSPAGRFLQVNRALADLLGHSEDTLLSLSVQDVTHPEDTPHGARQRQSLLRGTRTRHQHETRFLHADGSVVGILHSSSAVRGADGRPTLFIDHVEDVTDRRVFEARLQHQALHDPLTALPNRALFMDRLHQALQVDDSGTGNPSRVAVMFCDLDRFKSINDTHGHQVGDIVLTAIATRFRDAVGQGGTVARLGGDELVVLCPDVTAQEAASVADRLMASLREPISVQGEELRVTASVGIALSGNGRTTAEQLLRDSDDAMYQAKDAGRDRSVLHDPAHGVQLRRRLQLENELPRAIDEGQLRLHYQPQVDLTEGSVIGLEALVRWQHPQLGLLMPGDFIDVAESAGFMRELGRWVLREAVAKAAVDHRAQLELQGEGPTHGAPGLPVPVVWVNVSASELDDPTFAATVEKVLLDEGLPGGAIGLEITESVLMSDLNRVNLVLTQLRTIDIRLAIDDFGTGYSSLSYIAQFPVTTVKIDASFIAGLDDPDRAGSPSRW
ncbi:PAS domain S-box protein [Vibrio cholerae]|nr:PAS domain S-box protein [Vibrio cholerae]